MERTKLHAAAWKIERAAAVVAGARRDPRFNERLRTAVGGKTVVVTGASGGIGAHVAEDLGAVGATVVLVARTKDKLDVVAAKVRAGAGRADVIAADLSERDDVDRVAEEIVARHGHADVLVNNAGRSIRRSVMQTSDRMDDLERIFALNFFGSVRLTLGLLPTMVEAGGGHVVNVTTIGNLLQVPRFATYLASKAALEQYGRILATELAPKDVTVTTVHMPLVRTDMIAPSDIWNRHVAMNTDEGAALVNRAIVTRRANVSIGLRPFATALDAVAPRALQRAWASRLRH